MPLLLCLQKLQGKGDGGWKKVSLHCFLADQKIMSAWRNMRNEFLLVAGHTDYGPSKFL